MAARARCHRHEPRPAYGFAAACRALFPDGEADGATTFDENDPADVLIERSHEVDLLVIGSRGYGPLRSVLLGGVSGRVIRDAACPVIVVPRGAEVPLEALLASHQATA